MQLGCGHLLALILVHVTNSNKKGQSTHSLHVTLQLFWLCTPCHPKNTSYLVRYKPYIDRMIDAFDKCLQGTIGVELLEQVPDLDAIVVPVSGGGMISGIALAARGIKPQTKG